MVEPGSDPGLSAGPSETPPSGRAFSSWDPKKKLFILGGGGMGFLLLVYLYAKHKSSTASTSSTTASTNSTNSTTPTLVLPTSNQDAVDGADYSSLTQGLGNLSNQVSTLQSQQNNNGGNGGVSQPNQPPPNVPPSILNSIPGQTIVSEQYDPATKGWLALSNKGGIFALNAQGQPGPGYFGNPLADPGTDGWVNNGQWQRTAEQLTVRPSGGYTITDTAGENYSYGPA